MYKNPKIDTMPESVIHKTNSAVFGGISVPQTEE
jgi:hypothetical protein